MATFQVSDSDSSASKVDHAGTGLARKQLTVTFEDVGIEVFGLGQDFGSNCLSVLGDLVPSFGKSNKSKRHILQGVSGQVCPGEMLLVLGRPGSGCTSLLKVLSNQRDEFQEVTGQVRYGNIGHEAAKQFRHQIVMNTEDVRRHPQLPAIGHTKDTMVGDEFVRGVSGGERKRVSLAEVMSTQAPLQCWDNSTRGLDASNALDFARVLRKSANEQRKTIIATLYQAGNGIYDCFDKVLVLAGEGREIYYGPAAEARAYFENMGFKCPPGANVADFLTSVAVHTERTIRPGFEGSVPNTAEEFEARFKSSETYRVMKSVATAKSSDSSLVAEIEDLKLAGQMEKIRTIGFLSREKSPYTASFPKQVWACSKRQFQILWGDRFTNGLQLASSIVMALVTGSLMYNLPGDSSSIFRRPGALFYPILLWGLNKMSETVASFMGRPIFTRHKRLGFNRPAAYAFACALTDVPFIVVMFSLFDIVYYFMVGYQHDVGRFFTQWLIYVLITLCFASLYRLIGAWCRHFGLAAQISGFMTMIMMVYAGYLIPIPNMHPWFRWIAYINPASYAFNAVMASEMGNRQMTCVEPQFVPFGPSYDSNQYRSCTTVGSAPGDDLINGAEYLYLQYDIHGWEIWRDVGILIAFWVFFATIAAIGFEVNLVSGAGSKVLYDRRSQQKELADSQDPEKTQAQGLPEQGDYAAAGSTVFTFKDISYFVHHEGKEKQLLQNVSGYVKPGQLVALMGSSGAGKTTLMDVLAQRKDSGRIDGSIMVNGKPQGISFQRTTGYCEQNDVHEPTATVFESLVFSARLRQDYSVPDADKITYVNQIMELLELTPLKHALVGVPGSGLSIEQRKRLTLATELVAKPSLLFLDEPTSGLDGQSAYEICRFMRKLAASGQTIICTIHQPSAALFEAFDVLLLLAKGGRTTYFGPTGQDSSIVLDYFSRNGAAAVPDVNPAEHIVDVVQGRFGTDIDWPEVWNASKERTEALAELERLDNGQTMEKSGITSETTPEPTEAETKDFATPVMYQVKLVTTRQSIALWRNPDYIWNKISLHVTNALFGGFTFWMIGNGSFELQLRLMAVFNFVFVAPGCINQLQPLFIKNRDLFETREKKSKAYHWLAFISAQLLSEIPVLIVCATVYFASKSGQVYLEMILYEFLYTAIGQAIAAYSPSEVFAALANPVFVGAGLINFCGVVVPYSQIQAFWRYWIYWLDPFTYLIGGLLEPVVWDVKVQCKPNELTRIPVPPNSTCGTYLADFLATSGGYVVDPDASNTCEYCAYTSGADYMRTMNINESYYGWRDVGITALFCISSYGLVFLMMKLRSKATKKAG
ncbi:ABC-2 type transporter-domain-containing protein [Apiospora hydei]|uniref:ABC-2 type transporter-domain-containing protein n=1 Tax=Apiospora hydei TaxID=1337664 RepID=A0ABR1X8I5_9PEZI